MATFLNRNHTYEIHKVGYTRTVPIEAVDENTFLGKKEGTRGFIIIPANHKITISIEAFLDNDQIGVFVAKFNPVTDKADETFGAIIDRDDLLQILKKPGDFS